MYQYKLFLMLYLKLFIIRYPKKFLPIFKKKQKLNNLMCEIYLIIEIESITLYHFIPTVLQLCNTIFIEISIFTEEEIVDFCFQIRFIFERLIPQSII